MSKKVDERIRTLIENGVKTKHRSIFVIVGYKSSYQVVKLHHILSKLSVKARPSVLWCYKNKLELSRRKEKGRKQLMKKPGLLDPQTADPFLLFLESGVVTYSLYKDSENILGNTYGMCVLQDFEALTPNLLARTVETVEGGGLVVLLLRSLTSIAILYTMVMDVHERYRTSQASSRFSERLLLSLESCKACLVLDDVFNILPILSHTRSISAVVIKEDSNGHSESEMGLKNLKDQELDGQSCGAQSLSGHLSKKVELSESITYAPGDPVESWLNSLLCLDVANSNPNISRLPSPDECDLYYVNRDTLFSYHKESEMFLQRMMSLYLSSHYKNSPNDLQLMADAPAHHLFVLLGHVDESKKHLPDILCVIQVCLEGKIPQKSAVKRLSQGHQPSGDQIPWKFCEQFNDTVFPTLFGARIVRIATHPNAMRLGYGSVAVQLLTRYYEGQLTTISEEENESDMEKSPARVTEITEKVLHLQEQLKSRKDLPCLFVHLHERRPERLHYLAVSFGLTLELFRFWRKHNFGPFYICPVPSAVTGEHTCMVLKALKNDDIDSDASDEWGFFGPFYREYKERFTRLLQSEFRNMDYKLAMSIIDPKINFMEQERVASLSNEFLSSPDIIMTSRDLQRLESYVNNPVDYHSINDLVFDIARQYFRGRFPVTLSYLQASVLLCMGLQCQDVSYVEGQMMLERTQILSLFTEAMKKLLDPRN